MEPAWYFFPGQKEEITKYEDRGKALVSTKEAWNRITSTLKREQEQAEIIRKEEERRNYLKNGSYNMTKNWDNSIEKIAQRRLEGLVAKIKEKEDEKYRRYLELRQEQEEERKKIVVEKKRMAFMFHTEKPRNLNSSLLFSEILYERDRQLEFNQQIVEHNKIEELKEGALLKYNAQCERDENAAKEKKRIETNKKNAQDIQDQIQLKIEEEKIIKEENMALERIDNIRSKEEIAAIQQYEHKVDQAKKAFVKNEYHQFLEVKKQRKEKEKEQSDKEDKIVNICAKFKCRLNQERARREKQIIAEKMEIRAKIAAKIFAEQQAAENEEERVLANAKQEYDENERIKLQKKKDYQQKLLDDMEAYRKEWNEQKAKLLKDAKELEKWTLLNRLKTNEVYKKYNFDKAQREFAEKIAYRKELFKQMAESEERIKHEKYCEEQELQAYLKKLDQTDKDFFVYADQILHLAKSRDRMTYPIDTTIHNYKVENSLVLPTKNLSQLQSKVPINNKNR